MKILVDETLLQEQDWFDIIPVKIDNDKTAYSSPEYVAQLIDPTETTLIFTIPKTLSGQYNTYQSLNSDKVLVMEGTAFFSEWSKIKEIVKLDDLKVIEQKINALNKTITYEGIIIDARKVSIKNRIGWIASKLLTSLRIKVSLKFEDGKWSKQESSLSGFKLFKKALANKDVVTLIISESFLKKVNSYIERLTDKPTISIVYKTRVMEAQSGAGFIAIY